MKMKAIWQMASVGISIYPFWWGWDSCADRGYYMVKLGPIRLDLGWPLVGTAERGEEAAEVEVLQDWEG